MGKVLFIAYSHDNEDHKKWVKKFANDLMELGEFEVLLDQELPKGYPLTRFMELGISRADKVLIIGTPEYKKKSEQGKGAAFEGSIISTELMNDIDSIKYYPILRSGTFETSFPTILQGRTGDDFTNDAEYEIKLQNVVDAITNEKDLPNILKNGNAKQEQYTHHPVANVDLSQGVLFETYFGKPTGKIEGVAITVVVTNCKKEARFFNQPIFRTSIPIVGTNDSFQMLNALYQISFPVKLEYGEQFSISYKLNPANIEMFSSLHEKDPNVTIEVIETTTLGEKSVSEPYNIGKILENAEYVK